MGDTYGSIRRYREAIEANRQALVFAPDLIHCTNRRGLELLQLEGRAGHAPRCPPGACRLPAIWEAGDQRLLLLLWERRPDSLLSLLPVIHPATDTTPWASLQRVDWTAQAQSLRGDTAAARLYYDSVVVLLNAEERANPDERGPHGWRGFALAALGRRAEALREARWLERFDDYPGNHWAGGRHAGRAVIMAKLGETSKALDEIEQLLARPG